MPLFRFKCDSCNQESTEILTVRQEIRATCKCGANMRRLWDAPAPPVIDFIAGYDIGLDKTFSTQKQRDEYLAANSDTVRRIKS